jgi:copper chaperone CopZ
VAKIEAVLKALDGVNDAKVYFNTGRIEVDHDPQKANGEDLVKAVRSAGYESSVSAF